MSGMANKILTSVTNLWNNESNREILTQNRPKPVPKWSENGW